MAIFICEKCGNEQEGDRGGRCKPKKCNKCSAENSFKKKEESK